MRLLDHANRHLQPWANGVHCASWGLAKMNRCRHREQAVIMGWHSPVCASRESFAQNEKGGAHSQDREREREHIQCLTRLMLCEVCNFYLP